MSIKLGRAWLTIVETMKLIVSLQMAGYEVCYHDVQHLEYP